MSAVDTSATRPSALARAWAFVVRVVMLELRIYESIGRVIVRRPAIPRGARGFTYHRPILSIMIIFIVLSAVEIPIIDLIVHQWIIVRVAFLVLGIWGLTWMIGFLCAHFVRPHTVGPEGIIVREGLELSVPLSWHEIATVARSHRVDEPKSPRIMVDETGGRLSVRMQNETNIEIGLERPTIVHLPGQAPKGGRQSVTTLRLWVDDIDGFMAAVRDFIP